MRGIEGINQALLQSQLTAAQTQQAAGVKVAAKTLQAARDEGAAVVKLLEGAAELARQNTAGANPPLSALVSGLGQNLDVCG